jgi:hypothetical protein
MKIYLQIFKNLVKRIRFITILNIILIIVNSYLVVINYSNHKDFSWWINVTIVSLLLIFNSLLLIINISKEYNKIKPKGQIVSVEDPFGEENWNS